MYSAEIKDILQRKLFVNQRTRDSLQSSFEELITKVINDTKNNANSQANTDSLNRMIDGKASDGTQSNTEADDSEESIFLSFKSQRFKF